MQIEDNEKSSNERRRHRRFKAPGETYAVFRAPHPMLGRIIDISEGGLSILYIEGDLKPTSLVEFDLFTLSDDVKVNAIAAVARSDQELSGEDSDDPEIKRRRGIEFVGLRDGQKEAVRELILKQTDGKSIRDCSG